jgi:hypothetical protein
MAEVVPMRWLPESRLAHLIGVPRSTLTSWVASELVRPGVGGAYFDHDAFEVVVVSALREVLPVQALRMAMRSLRESGQMAAVIDRARRPGVGEPDRVDLVVDAAIGDVRVCLDAQALADAVRPDWGARTVTVIPVATALRRARRAIAAHGETGRPPTERRRGRPPGRAASVTQIR